MNQIHKKKPNIVVISAAVIGSMTATFFATQASSVKRTLAKTATELNKKYPMQIDADTRIDSTRAIEEDKFIYYYTLIHLEKSEVVIDTVNKYLRPHIINTAKTNPDMKYFRDHKVALDYKYYDKNGEFITSIDVTPDMYEPPE